MQAAAAVMAIQLQMVDVCWCWLCKGLVACTIWCSCSAGNYGAPNGFWFDPWAQDPPLMVGRHTGQPLHFQISARAALRLLTPAGRRGPMHKMSDHASLFALLRCRMMNACLMITFRSE